MRQTVVAMCLGVVAGAAFAHSGVKNAAVMARMDAMSAIGAEMKVLGEMAKGTVVFDPDKARAATVSIARYAERTPELFAAREEDPKSEARPEIWTNFADFTEKSDALRNLALELSQSLRSEADLPQAVASLGKACKACHAPYRE